MSSASRVHKMGAKRGRPRMTIEERLHGFLKRQGKFTPLSDIYKRMRACTTGEKAGIRGLLNRGCSEKNLFVRSSNEQGRYKAA